jgi:predicted SnoaL-like aldol condensation-catalyzing enzyme
MKLTTFTLAGLALLVAGSSLFAETPQETKNQELAQSWYRDTIILGHLDQASKYMADNYVEHDPRISGGRSGFVRYYQNPSLRPSEAKQITSFPQGDYVIFVWSHDDKDPKSQTPYKYTTFDVVRIKNGKIQEHWNNAKKETKW